VSLLSVIVIGLASATTPFLFGAGQKRAESLRLLLASNGAGAALATGVFGAPLGLIALALWTAAVGLSYRRHRRRRDGLVVLDQASTPMIDAQLEALAERVQRGEKIPD
jgi:hypothetical protein